MGPPRAHSQSLLHWAISDQVKELDRFVRSLQTRELTQDHVRKLHDVIRALRGGVKNTDAEEQDRLVAAIGRMHDGLVEGDPNAMFLLEEATRVGPHGNDRLVVLTYETAGNYFEPELVETRDGRESWEASLKTVDEDAAFVTDTRCRTKGGSGVRRIAAYLFLRGKGHALDVANAKLPDVVREMRKRVKGRSAATTEEKPAKATARRRTRRGPWG